jgi:glucose/arabinose dehydrogenase
LTTHTLQLERDLTRSIALLIANGPKTNIDVTARDPASGRSQIRRFPFPSPVNFHIPPPTQNWDNGQIIAFGIRNPAGFAFPPFSSHPNFKTLLVVENGASIDGTSNLTSTFVNDNPADELDLVTFSSLIPTTETTQSAPQSYGFPDCTTLWNPVADPIGNPQFIDKQRGDQFSLELDPTHGDDFCSNTKNNQPPVFSFQAHSVPLDIKFYDPSFALSSSDSLPTSFQNNLFVSFHGSFNRKPPTGYGVVMCDAAVHF